MGLKKNLGYESSNAAKADFDAIYKSPTPVAYFAEMGRLGYEIGQQALPYFSATARLLQEQLGPEVPVRALDLGCSYGVGAALLNHDVSFSELAQFYSDLDTPRYDECVELTRQWLADRRSPEYVGSLGLDASAEAVRFAEDAGLIDCGIARNLEHDPTLSPEEIRAIRRCNLLTSTGAIGYVGDKTLSALLAQLGGDLRHDSGPYAVVTILRLFDPAPVAATMRRFGYHFAPLSDVRLRQRRFESDEEQTRTLELLEQRGIDPEGWESEGFLYADLFAAAPPDDFPVLARRLQETRAEAGRVVPLAP